MAYSNSPLVTYTRLSPHNSGTRTHAIDRITIHHAVGQFTASGLCACFCGARQASANYVIGHDGEVGLSVEEGNRSWCSSSEENDQRAVTIECADDSYAPYKMNDVAYERLIELCVDICKRNGKRKLIWLGNKAKTLAYTPADDEMVMTVHRWFLPTQCPGDWLMGKMPEIAERVTAELQKARFTGDSTPATWAQEAVDWAVNNGLMVGDKNGDLMLHSPITREQFCVMLKRYHDIFSK